MSAETPDIGVTSAPGASFVKTFKRALKLAKNALLLTSDGKVSEDTDFDPVNEFSVAGLGDLPDAFVAGATVASDDSVLVGASGGKTVVKETSATEKNVGYNEFSVTAANYPSA